MDSLTQITLGAAVGEALLGRKIGNRAMLWGAIGGTIPDLDVIGNLFLDPIAALAFHRGITHSLTFAAILPVPLGWVIYKLYKSGTYQRSWYKFIVSAINVLLLGLILYGLYFAFGSSPISIPMLIIPGAYLSWRLYRYYLNDPLKEVSIAFREWYLLFFLALSTHFVLDCFTAFGTQVFAPFSNYRVAFNSVSVVDPLYTVPFLICVIVAACKNRISRSRRIWNWTGIVISSAYLVFTVFNKISVDKTFERALANRNIEVARCRTSPVIFTNFLWNCTAESDSVYYSGLYSNFDSDPNLHYINTLPKREAIAKPISGLDDYLALQWFSDGYLLHQDIDTAIVLSDIRFGGIRDTIRSHRDLVFNFFAKPQPDGSWEFTETRERPDDMGKALRELWVRILGY